MGFPFHIEEHVIDAQYVRDSPRATATPNSTLKLCVKKYTPIDNPHPQPGDVTIIATHGTGLIKELYEPLWEELIARSKENGFRVRAIWIADSTNQGASGILNEEKLGNNTSWFDHGRDLIQMINHFRDDMPQPIIGVGHSLGATQLIFASIYHPRLFTSLLLVEPYIMNSPMAGNGPEMLAKAAFRRDKWPSREEASTKARRALEDWDPRVFERWIKFGYRDLPTAIYPTSTEPGAVTLTTTKYQETMMYTHINYQKQNPVVMPGEVLEEEILKALPERQMARSEPILAFKMVPHLAPSVFYISGSKSPLYRDGSHTKAAEVTGTEYGGNGGLKSGQVRHEVMEDCGHIVPLEDVVAVSRLLGTWIQREVRTWKESEEKLAAEWYGLPGKEKITFPKDWLEIASSYTGKKSMAKL
ncbi:hypothetical protein N7523_000934 [Penicillium sp. IBT 18751x]|nr:hypothetical protein N7523_000934 [Penicillium sp. IBT 18751x]